VSAWRVLTVPVSGFENVEANIPIKKFTRLASPVPKISLLYGIPITIKSYKKKQWRPPSKKKKRGKKLSLRNTKACHSVSTAIEKSVAEIGT
jgi:hypothetical protein